MKRWHIPCFISCFALPLNSNAYGDNHALSGKVERNQLDPSIKIEPCPKQEGFAKAINKSLAGYAFAPLLKSSAQNAALNTSVQNNTINLGTQKTQLQSQTNASAAKLSVARNIQDVLANHDLAIVVDRSGSMSTEDCPGHVSRWQWCCKQAFSLAQAAAQASSAVTLMFFNSDLQVFDNVNPTNIPVIFNTFAPAGGTVMSAPLTKQLDRYFASRAKPLIIVVISDGIPQDTDVLAPMIADASDSLHYAGEVTISFLLIGNQIDGQQFKHLLGELDGGSIKNGGMVDVIDFRTLCAKGIRQTLFEELKTITLNTNKTKPSNAEKFAVGASLISNHPMNPFPLYSSNAITNPFPVSSLAAAKISKASK